MLLILNTATEEQKEVTLYIPPSKEVEAWGKMMPFPLSQKEILLFLPFASQAHRSLLYSRWKEVTVCDFPGHWRIALPQRSLSTVPELTNGTQLCLKPLNYTTLWPSQPAAHNPSDSGSNEAMAPLRRAAAAPSHFLGFTKCHFVLLKGFRVDRLPEHMNSRTHVCCQKAQGHLLTHTKYGKFEEKDISRLCAETGKVANSFLILLFPKKPTKSFALPSRHF